MARPILTNTQARRLFLDRHLLLGRASGTGRGADLQQLLRDLAFVQVDSVNTLARAHDMILWARRGQYRPAALDRLVARDRAAFEHWTHDASVIPIEYHPMWRLKFEREAAYMHKRWPASRREGWRDEVNTVLRHVSDHGATCSTDVGGDEPKNSSGWWDWHPSKTALEYLWRAGDLAICHRRGFRKYYDLTERVIPAVHRKVLPTEDIIDWAMQAAMDRLGFATSGELAAFFAMVTPDEAKGWCETALADGRLIEVDVTLTDGSIRRSYSTEAHLDHIATLPEPSTRVRILSPFDPALRDRKRAERLFGFRYRIEIFVPAAKREYGYYVFPVMQGDRLIGRIDAKRDGTTLAVRAFWPEPKVRMGRGRQAGLMAELDRICGLAGCDAVRCDPDWLR